METLHFTKAALAALPTPVRRTRYRDAGQPGLIVAVYPSGGRVFFGFKRKGKLHEHQIGAYPAMSIEVARQRARDFLSSLEEGRDPREALGKGRGSGQTFGDLWAWWVEAFGRGRAGLVNDQGVYRLHIEPRIGNRQARLISRADVRAIQADLAANVGAATANKAIALVRVVLARAITEERFVGANPAAGIPAIACAPRERRLRKDEVGALFKALAGSEQDVQDFVLLTFFTGARRGNVQAMRWDELDLSEGEEAWRIPKTKGGKAQTIPLEEAELVIIRRRRDARRPGNPWVFPGRADGTKGHIVDPSNGWKGVRERSGLHDLHLHDLRRSMGSWMLRSGAKMEVIAATLGHSSIKVTERVYAHMDNEPIREAKRLAQGAIESARGPAEAPAVAPDEGRSKRRAKVRAIVRRAT